LSGHSKWSTIKHKKAALDAKRGKLWSKLARNLTVAAKKGAVPEDNPTLRLAVDKARAANMPKDTIEKAIQKAVGGGGGQEFEEILYEGYGPNGVAVMCKVITDNRNRTGPEIKKLFERCGGNLGGTNCVAFMFRQRGVIVIEHDKVEEDKIMEIALESGADDVETSELIYEITTSPGAFERVKKAVEEAEIQIQSADISMVAANNITLDLTGAQKVMKLLDALEDHDDVDAVYSNSDVPDNVIAQMS
jgi:YebC/PmpR family DNA-binding regulatory protein